jgi:hypothetical protein
VANLALALAAGLDAAGFAVPAHRRVLVCQFELPLPQLVRRLAIMRRRLGPAADQNLCVDTEAAGHLLSAPEGLGHFLAAAQAAAAEVLVLDPLYSTHDQDENDTRAMAALCQSLLHLRDAAGAALIVVHHVRKSIGREEIGSAFPSVPTLELRFQFRYAAPQPPRLLALDPDTLWFAPAGHTPAATTPRRKVDAAAVRQAVEDLGGQVRYTELRQHLMRRAACSKRTAQLAITAACEHGVVVPDNHHYRLPA